MPLLDGSVVLGIADMKSQLTCQLPRRGGENYGLRQPRVGSAG